MARATKVIHKMKVDPEVEHDKALHEIEELFIEHKDSLNDVLKMMEKMREREFFNIANASLGQSSKIVTRLVTALDGSKAPHSIHNLLLLFELLSSLDMDSLEPVAHKLNNGIAQAAKYDKSDRSSGYRELFAALKDPEVLAGLNMALQILKGLGQKDSSKKNDSVTGSSKRSTRASRSNSSMKWYPLVLGAAAVSVPLLLKFKN
ncbi:helical membrane plugin domain-containing protein [Salinicoccus sp. CNSTN-B1]